MILSGQRIALRQAHSLADGCEPRLTIPGRKHIARGIRGHSWSDPQERARQPVGRNRGIAYTEIREPIRRGHVDNHPGVDGAEPKSPPYVFQPWGTWIENAFSLVLRTVVHFVPVAAVSAACSIARRSARALPRRRG